MSWISPISSSSSGLRITFSTRFGGVSKGDYSAAGNSGGLNLGSQVGDDPARVLENRRIARDLFGLPPVVYMNQVHGDEVAIITRENQAQTPTADALVTSERGIALAVLVADCVPLVMHDRATDVIAAVHVGRRGLTNGIVERAVAAMKSLGASSIRAVMGPAICGDCYEVPLALQREVVAHTPAAAAITSAGTPGLDIRDGVRWQLENLDVDAMSDLMCTRQSQLHYSYRRAAITGRNAGFVYLQT